MQVGKRNRQVQLQRLATVQDAQGSDTTTWTTFATVWANVRHPSGMETTRSDVPVTVTKASFNIRFRTDVDATCRILYAGRQYDIKAALPDETGRQWLELAAEAGQNQG